MSERAPSLDRFGSDGRQLDAADGLTAYLRAAVLTMRPAQARARATLAIADRSRRHLVRAFATRSPAFRDIGLVVNSLHRMPAGAARDVYIARR